MESQHHVPRQRRADDFALNAANQTLQLIPIQLQTVNELYSAISGYDNNSNG